MLLAWDEDGDEPEKALARWSFEEFLSLSAEEIDRPYHADLGGLNDDGWAEVERIVGRPLRQATAAPEKPKRRPRTGSTRRAPRLKAAS